MSGTELGRRLGISRAAVWKRIQGLQRAGYRIQSVRGLGYQLCGEPDSLAPEAVEPLLTGTLFRPDGYRFFPELGSSNEEVVAQARAGAAEGLVVVADCQTAGRGRLDRSWSSPPGVNLYFSFLLRPALPPGRTFQLTLLAGLALAETLVGLGIAGLAIKWPNDLLLDGRKLGGILTEMAAEPDHVQYVVVGVGLNVNQPRAAFPPELQGIAATLREVPPSGGGGDPVDFWPRRVILAGFLRNFATWYRRFLQEGFPPVRQGWLRYAAIRDRRVQVNLLHERFSGQAVDMDPEGFLLVKQDDGPVRKVVAGDVALLSR